MAEICQAGRGLASADSGNTFFWPCDDDADPRYAFQLIPKAPAHGFCEWHGRMVLEMLGTAFQLEFAAKPRPTRAGWRPPNSESSRNSVQERQRLPQERQSPPA